jgi:hypothetical protein
MKKEQDARLAKVAGICDTLPEAARTDQGSHAAFTVRKKTFAYFLNDHHGDGIVSVCARAFPGKNKALVAAHPQKFYCLRTLGHGDGLGFVWIAGRLTGQKCGTW